MAKRYKTTTITTERNSLRMNKQGEVIGSRVDQKTSLIDSKSSVTYLYTGARRNELIAPEVLKSISNANSFTYTERRRHEVTALSRFLISSKSY